MDWHGILSRQEMDGLLGGSGRLCRLAWCPSPSPSQNRINGFPVSLGKTFSGVDGAGKFPRGTRPLREFLDRLFRQCLHGGFNLLNRTGLQNCPKILDIDS